VLDRQAVLIMRSLGLGIIFGALTIAAVAGVFKLFAPRYAAGDIALALGLLVLVITTAITVRRGERRSHTR
jgi:hypothetical protein